MIILINGLGNLLKSSSLYYPTGQKVTSNYTLDIADGLTQSSVMARIPTPMASTGSVRPTQTLPVILWMMQ